MKTNPRNALGARTKMTLVGMTCIALLGACSSGGGSSSGTNEGDPANAEVAEVNIATFQFQPKTLTIPVGTTVRWTNGDGILHTATSGVQTRQGVPGVTKDKAAKPDGTFDLQLDGKGSFKTFTFDEAGTYRYYCSAHAAMTGRVVVE